MYSVWRHWPSWCRWLPLSSYSWFCLDVGLLLSLDLVLIHVFVLTFTACFAHLTLLKMWEFCVTTRQFDTKCLEQHNFNSIGFFILCWIVLLRNYHISNSVTSPNSLRWLPPLRRLALIGGCLHVSRWWGFVLSSYTLTQRVMNLFPFEVIGCILALGILERFMSSKLRYIAGGPWLGSLGVVRVVWPMIVWPWFLLLGSVRNWGAASPLSVCVVFLANTLTWAWTIYHIIYLYFFFKKKNFVTCTTAYHTQKPVYPS